LACATRSRFPKLAIDPRKREPHLRRRASAIPTDPNEERGIFRSTDGGQHFERVLFKDVNTGGKDVDIDPVQPRHRLRHDVGAAPGTVGERRLAGHQRRDFQVDRRRHDVEAADQGLPRGLINAELGIAPSSPRRIFATIEAGDEGTGIFRSDDAGESWTRITADKRPTSRINEAVPHVHPTDPETVIVTDIVSFKSTDGGRTFVPFKGAPGGRRQSEHLVESDQSRRDAARRRSGRGGDAERRRNLELVVHATDLRALHVMTDSAFSLSRVRRPAGQRLGVHCQPRQRRPDHVS
jgi:hypothetical protein